jgi:DNA invertase Pin-like site-specific DNA recombinase
MAMADNVTVIPAKKAVGIQQEDSSLQKTRVAAYCRVSTDYEEQESSYETQVKHYTDYIKANPAWELAGIFADDGISGTNTKKRTAFNNMIDECKAGKIDMIITKSISRFSRNTVDCLKYTRELKNLNIAVYFEKENINTLDAKGEVLLTIMASLAQQESESLSANVKMGIQFRNQQGKVRVNYSRFLGYTKGADGNLVIDEDQAKVVRRIYREYLDGNSYVRIARKLQEEGIENGSGSTKWWPTNVRQILRNEKYIGDALLQKTVTVSVLDKTRKKNNGSAPQYYVKNSQPAIIDRDTYMRVQAEMERRANMSSNGRKRCFSSRYALSGIVFCGLCGDIYRRVKWYKPGKITVVWRCVTRLYKNKTGRNCTARTIHEDDLHAAVVTAVNDAWARKDSVIPELERNVREAIKEEKEKSIEQIDAELKKQQEVLLAAGNDEVKIEKTGKAIRKLQKQRREALINQSKDTETKERTDDLACFLEKQTEAITEYDDLLVTRLVKRIIIFEEKIVVEFKSGLQIEVEA